MRLERLERLETGQPVVFGGDRVVTVPPALAAAFGPGDALLVDERTGELLHVPSAVREAATSAVTAAVDAAMLLGAVDDATVDRFFLAFAARLEDDATFAPVAAANARDVATARERGRSTTRLVLSARMRTDMAEGLRGWTAIGPSRGTVSGQVSHDGWELELVRDRLGVVAFVFEGRPNVVADACGVLRGGNTVVFRIGSDALGTAEALMAHAVAPALAEAGLPAGSVSLVRSSERAAGWALFADDRIALAVARGSGAAVEQLGGIARRRGTPVSLHGTGGAWMLVTSAADPERLRATVRHSLDRKVCNTVNVVVLSRATATRDILELAQGVTDAAHRNNGRAIVHVSSADRDRLGSLPDSAVVEWMIDDSVDLSHEWEWDYVPELSVCLAEDVAEAVEMFNRYSPQFVLSVISSQESDHDLAWTRANAPFVADGFSRWVDGQYALDRPELGLANWQYGRLLARGGVLSGDGVHTLRLRVLQRDIELRR